MKSKIIALLSVVPFISFAQQHFTLNGQLPYAKAPLKAYLVYQDQGKLFTDSAEITNGTFTFQGNVSLPMKAFLMTATNGAGIASAPSSDQTIVYLENGTLAVTAKESLMDAMITGTPLNKDQAELSGIMKQIIVSEEKLSLDFDRADGDTAIQKEIKNKFMDLQSSRSEQQIKFIKTHSASLVALNLLRAMVNPATDIKMATELFATLSPELKESSIGKSYASLITGSKAVLIGQQAPDFTLPGVDGKQVSLSSYQGKYVLVDFWASWCVPCRKENPNLVKVFQQFRDKNFTILGVSLDGGGKARENWLAAIEKDNLPWNQVSDVNGWEGRVTKQYQVTAIPANYLIDPSGKIIAKDLNGADLQVQLQKLLK